MTLAVQQIRRMRGGAQAHLMRCDGGQYYVVKFQNNPQGSRILVNELLATRLAARLGLPMPRTAIIEVRQGLIEHTDDLVIRVGRGSEICKAGMQFGSLYPGSPAETPVYDFLPDDQLREASNLADFCGIFVFDKWTCNTNGRQAVFFRTDGEPQYRAQMIDQGFCFNAAEWSFPDAPLRGLYNRHRVYESVRGMSAFDPWIARIETKVTPSLLDEISREIPPEWYNDEQDSLWKLLEQLLRRKKLVPELIISAWKSSAQPFPNWK